MMDDTEEAVAVDTHLPEDPYSPMNTAGGGAATRAQRNPLLSPLPIGQRGDA